eukprot:Sspe_Gene.8773::Locus_2964_Transcript_2_3_Confidence_0.500_Length_1696::g.8773::m.8773
MLSHQGSASAPPLITQHHRTHCSSPPLCVDPFPLVSSPLCIPTLLFFDGRDARGALWQTVCPVPSTLPQPIMPSPWYRPVQGVVRQEVAGGSPVHTPVFADGGTPEDPQESERHPPPEAPASPVRVATTPPAATPPRHNTRGSTIESRHAAGVSSAP